MYYIVKNMALSPSVESSKLFTRERFHKRVFIAFRRELYDRAGVCEGTNHLLQGVYTESKARGMIQGCLASVSGHLKTWLEISLLANQMDKSSSLPLLDPDQLLLLQSFAVWIQTDKGR